MQRVVLRARVHRATVSDADLGHDGSCPLGAELLSAELIGSQLATHHPRNVCVDAEGRVREEVAVS
ncbi:MAG: hypothetical protein M3Z57_00545 [Candidatus Dormibacteraeota bacterium]|nr:hypothetical protein [Candidatus Dormibacteraeota bacterium]